MKFSFYIKELVEKIRASGKFADRFSDMLYKIIKKKLLKSMKYSIFLQQKI